MAHTNHRKTAPQNSEVGEFKLGTNIDNKSFESKVLCDSEGDIVNGPVTKSI